MIFIPSAYPLEHSRCWKEQNIQQYGAVCVVKHSCFATLGTSIAGSFVYISDDPLFEWHGFATVTEPGKKGFSLVVSRAGDWTAKQIDNPPSTLWI